MKKKLLPYHTILFALFPSLFLYNQNVAEVSIVEIIPSTLTVVFFAVILTILLNVFVKNIIKSSVLTSLFIVLFFSFMHVYAQLYFLKLFYPGNLMIYLYSWYLGIYLSLFYIVVKTRRRLINLTKIANFISLSLVVLQLAGIVSYQLSKKTYIPAANSTVVGHQSIGAATELPKRDIYYLVFDRYGSTSVLEKYYDFDNSEIEEFLEEKGFYIARGSRSNYLKTAHSLASSLNMTYLDDLSISQGLTSEDWKPIYSMLEDYSVQRFLKNKGYKTFHFGSWWEQTSTNRFSDENVNTYPISEYSKTLYQMSLAYPIGKAFGVFEDRRIQWERINLQIERLLEIPKDKDPTFVFAHFLLPHPPYVFDKEGKFVSEQEELEKSLDEKYLDQVAYANKLIKLFVNEALSTGDIEPIIIIQSDEGPYPDRYMDDPYKFKWFEATSEELDKKTGILNAYYFPGETTGLHQNITPVNTFRLVFANYFDSDLQLYPNRIYIFPEHTRPYEFRDVTEILPKLGRQD